MSLPNDEGVGVCGTNPPKNLDNQQLDFACTDGDGKALATMRARATLASCTLRELPDCGFLLGALNNGKAVPCLRAVGNLLRQIGGR